MGIWKVVFTLVVLLVSLRTDILVAQEKPALLPMPKHIVWTNDSFRLDSPFSLVISVKTSSECKNAITDLREFSTTNNLTCNYKEAPSKDEKHSITFHIEKSLPEIQNNPEGYILDIKNQSINISAVTPEGIFYGVQTLKQLYLEANDLKSFYGCKIIDYPAFRLRGFMHDVGRSFISIENLKQQVKILSFYKINTFHWHLTEDIAWRLESKLHPELTDSASMTRFKGQYYSREEVKDFETYCSGRNVTIIPEIDMPGHSAAFRRATGFDMQSAEGKKILSDVLIEACQLFKSPYFHLGTDEVKITDASFVPEMQALVRKMGKTVISWSPGAKSDTLTISQMWGRKSLPEKHGKFIDSQFLYLNHMDPFADLSGVYNNFICSSQTGNDRLLGGIVCIWNDRKLKTENDILLANAFYPNMLAFAERSWVGGGTSLQETGTSLGDRHSKRFEDFTEFEKRMLAHKRKYFNALPFPYVKQSDIQWRITDAFPNKGNLLNSFPPETEKDTVFNFRNKSYATRKANGAAIYLRHTWGPEVVPGFYKNPLPNSTAYAFTWVYSPEDQKTGLWISFHNYGRSEKDFTPQPGKWDYKESWVKINDSLIEPPKWANAMNPEATSETDYVDEPFGMRPPVSVFLHKGWNYVLLKLPVGQFSTKETRLVKWMFTCVFVTENKGQIEACPDLIYNPDHNLNNN